MFLCPVLLLLLPPETILSGLNQTGYPGEVSTTPKCRSRGLSLPEEEFRLHTCALCYHFMHPTSFQPTTRWTKVDGDIMRLKFGNATVLADVSDDDSPLLQSFAHPEAEANWRACCLEADRCCQNMTANNKTTDPGWCPRTWDGWLCWQDSPPHTTQRRPCPPFIHFGTAKHDCPLKAEKHCVAGWWGGHPENSSIEWTDYTTCSIVKDLKRRMHIGMAALSVSIAALLPALLIFNVYRQLNGVRISLHRNLFTSLLLNALCDIWFKVYILNSKSGVASPIRENDALCKVVLLLTKYFRLSNYLWMFCEGLYLHRVISSSFAQNERLVVFYSIGWGLPLAFVLLYALFRALFSDTDCWAFPTSYSEWILYVPCLFSLLVNTIFLVNIIRILMSKLRASHSQESSQYRKAVRATLVLVPLFGLHFVVTIYRPANGICRWEEYYVYLDCLLDGLQGAFVAIIFCYWNGEIRSLLRRSYQNFVDRKSPRRRNGTITKYLSSSAATSTHGQMRHSAFSVWHKQQNSQFVSLIWGSSSGPVTIFNEKSPQMQLEIVRLQT